MTTSIAPDTARQLARLLLTLVRGERIAIDCTHWQAQTTTDPRSRRVFRAQSRQERFHAQLFEGAALWLAPRVSVSESRCIVLDRYRRRLESAMSGNRWVEVLVGQQIVLETLGELVLARLDAAIDRRGLGFDRLRRTVLRQEQAHHAFGLRLIDIELQAGQMKPDERQALSEVFLALADDILVAVSPLLESLDEDAESYRREMRCRLPRWTFRNSS